MKAIIIEEKKVTQKPFPKLMRQIKGISKGAIILMSESGKGVVVSPARERGIGQYDGFQEYTEWDMESFEDFEGIVILRN